MHKLLNNYKTCRVADNVAVACNRCCSSRPCFAIAMVAPMAFNEFSWLDNETYVALMEDAARDQMQMTCFYGCLWDAHILHYKM